MTESADPAVLAADDEPDGVHYSESAQQLFAPTIFEDGWRAAQMASSSK